VRYLARRIGALGRPLVRSHFGRDTDHTPIGVDELEADPAAGLFQRSRRRRNGDPGFGEPIVESSNRALILDPELETNDAALRALMQRENVVLGAGAAEIRGTRIGVQLDQSPRVFVPLRGCENAGRTQRDTAKPIHTSIVHGLTSARARNSSTSALNRSGVST
jgi:hypothetical protein